MNEFEQEMVYDKYPDFLCQLYLHYSVIVRF